MRRFNYEDNDEYRKDVDHFFNEDDLSRDDYEAIIDEIETHQLEVKFVARDLNYRILRAAVKTCEKSFFWRFYSQDTRLELISKTYKCFRELEEDISFTNVETEPKETPKEN